MIKHYLVTVHVLIQLDDDVPGAGNCQASACDALSAILSESPEVKDWGYAGNQGVRLGPVEVTIAEPYQGGDIYSLFPTEFPNG